MSPKSWRMLEAPCRVRMNDWMLLLWGILWVCWAPAFCSQNKSAPGPHRFFSLIHTRFLSLRDCSQVHGLRRWEGSMWFMIAWTGWQGRPFVQKGKRQQRSLFSECLCTSYLHKHGILQSSDSLASQVTPFPLANKESEAQRCSVISPRSHSQCEGQQEFELGSKQFPCLIHHI